MKKPGAKRIILVASNDLEGDQRLHKVALTLQKRNWEPVLFGRKLKVSGPLSRPYPVKRIKLLFSKGPAFYACFNIRVFFHLLFIRADLFVANDLDTLASVWLASRFRRKAVIYDSHEYFTGVPELADRKRVQGIWKSIERRIQPKLDSVITVNDSIAELFKDEYHKDVVVIRNLPLKKPARIIPGYIPSEFMGLPLLIYQGAVNVGRGLEQLIEAMKHLPEYRLLIAGGGDRLQDLIRMTGENGLEGQIHFTGRIPFEQMRWYTQQANIGVSLEQDIGLNYRLSLPNKLFDYMHSGLPVIASDLPEIKKVVLEAGFGMVISDFSPSSLSNYIRSLWENQLMYNELRNNALSKASKYTWEEQEALLLDVYDRAFSQVNHNTPRLL